MGVPIRVPYLNTPECAASILADASSPERLLRIVATCATLAPSNPSSSTDMASPCSRSDPVLNSRHSYRPAAPETADYHSECTMCIYTSLITDIQRIPVYDYCTYYCII